MVRTTVAVVVAGIVALSILSIGVLQHSDVWPESPAAAQVSTAATVGQTSFICAPWLVGEQRKVLFLDIGTMQEFQSPNSTYKGGEVYCTASMDWALSQLGFQVEKQTIRKVKQQQQPNETFREYHRIFFNTDPRPYATVAPEIRCKIRPLAYYPGKHEYQGYHAKQILTAYPNEFNTFLGYFVHGLIETRAVPSSKQRRKGLLMGKEPRHFEGHQAAIAALLDAGFDLHATCTQCEFDDSRVNNHFMLSPEAFESLLQKCAFVVGFGYPPWSPTPFVAIASGTAFLNPVMKDTVVQRSGTPFRTQNNAVALLGKPYVYNYKHKDSAQMLQAAEEASSHRFPGYVPYELRPEAMIARVCAILEDDSPCSFPHQNLASTPVLAWGT